MTQQGNGPVKLTMVLEIEISAPLKNAEQGRYLQASIEEGISNGWYDFLMAEDQFPQSCRKVLCRELREKPL